MGNGLPGMPPGGMGQQQQKVGSHDVPFGHDETNTALNHEYPCTIVDVTILFIYMYIIIGQEKEEKSRKTKTTNPCWT